MKILIEFLPRHSEPSMRFEATHVDRDELFTTFTVDPTHSLLIANSSIAFIDVTEIPEEES